MIKKILLFSLALGAIVGLHFKFDTAHATTCLFPGSGGTGLCTATSSNVGQVIGVTATSSGPNGTTIPVLGFTTASGGSTSTYTVVGGTGVTSTVATGGGNTTTTVTLNINNGVVQTCGAGTLANSISATGTITCQIVVQTLAGVNTSTISFIAAGGTSIATTTNSITFSSISTSTANSWTALQTFTQGATINGTTTLASTTSALLLVNGSGQVSGFAGSNCSANNAPTGISATGTVMNCTAYLTGNQSITLTISGDATGTASGATSIADSIQVTGLLGKALPSLATGTLEYTGGVWTLGALPLTSYNVSCTSGCTVATTTTSAAITVTAAANNATGTIDAQAVFNATNTIVSTQPFTITPTLLAAGCVGSSTATTINGCVQAIIQNQQSVASGTNIIFSGFFSTGFTAGMNINTNGFPVVISCTAGTVLEYTGTQANASSGAITFNFGNPGGHDTYAEGQNCQLWGHTSKITAGQTNNATTTGIYFGGSNGAVGINWMGNINGFGINYVMGQNAYMDAFTGTSSGGNGGVITGTGNVINGSSTISNISNASVIPLGSYVSGTGIPNSLEVIGISGTNVTLSGTANATGTGATLTYQFGSLGQYDLANNSGERPIISGAFTDPGNSSATNALYITGGGVADWYCSLISLDDAQIHAGYSNGLIGCAQVHLEDSDYSQYLAYIPIMLDSSQATFADFGAISVANDPSAGNTLQGFQTIIKHGVNLYVHSLFIQNYNGATVINAVDHSLNNGSESEQICDVQTTNGSGLTNIVAGGGGNTYNQARGLGCSQDVANSYTISIYPNGNNTNNIDSGNSTVGTFDHTGNWTLGIAGVSGSLSLQGNFNATGTISQSGSAVAISAGNGVNGDCTKWTGANTLGDQGSACGSGTVGQSTSTYVTVYTASTTTGGFSGLTYTSSTGVLSAPTGTYSGTLAVGTSTQNGTLNVNGSANVSATTTVGTGSNNQFQVNPSTVKSYVVAGSSTVATTIGGTLAFSATSTGNGAGASTSIETFNIPTSTYLSLGDEVDFYAGGTFAATAATNKQVQIAVASTTIFDTGAAFAPANTACNWFVHGRGMATLAPPATNPATTTIIWASTYTDSCQNALTDDSGDAGNKVVTATTTAPINITIYGNGTNASDVVGNYFRVLYAPF